MEYGRFSVMNHEAPLGSPLSFLRLHNEDGSVAWYAYAKAGWIALEKNSWHTRLEREFEKQERANASNH